MSMFKSTNPVLADGRLETALQAAVPVEARATVGGVVNKTCLALGVAVVFGAIGNSVVQSHPGVLMPVSLVSAVVSLVCAFSMYGRPAWAAVLTPIYAATQGFFIGAVALVLDRILEAKGIQVAGGLALQAFLITGGITAACLLLYRTGAVRISQRFAFMLWCAVLGIGIAYLLAFVLGFFFKVQMPFLSLPTETGSGNGAMIGLAINAVILVVASLVLLTDIQQVDMAVASGAPASAEWYLAYGLVVSLIWIYMESLKIAFRIAMIFGGGKRN